MIKILLDQGADKTATVEDLYHPVDLLTNDRTRARECLKLARFEKRHCTSTSSGSSHNGSPELNSLDDHTSCSTMTPSPESSIIYK